MSADRENGKALIYSRGSQNSLKFRCIRALWGGLTLRSKSEWGLIVYSEDEILELLIKWAARWLSCLQVTLFSPTQQVEDVYSLEKLNSRCLECGVRLIEDRLRENLHRNHETPRILSHSRSKNRGHQEYALPITKARKQKNIF